jgi:hypothetical protein
MRSYQARGKYAAHVEKQQGWRRSGNDAGNGSVHAGNAISRDKKRSVLYKLPAHGAVKWVVLRRAPWASS